MDRVTELGVKQVATRTTGLVAFHPPIRDRVVTHPGIYVFFSQRKRKNLGRRNGQGFAGVEWSGVGSPACRPGAFVRTAPPIPGDRASDRVPLALSDVLGVARRGEQDRTAWAQFAGATTYHAQHRKGRVSPDCAKNNTLADIAKVFREPAAGIEERGKSISQTTYPRSGLCHR